MAEYNFQPSVTAPYQFQPTLDGSSYVATIRWNVFGQRWYILLQDQTGNTIFNQPLVPSQVGVQVASAVWDFNSQSVAVETQEPHGYEVGKTLFLTLSGMAPNTYDGTFECFVTSSTGFEYEVATNPGTVTSFGAVSYNVNMVAGYFTSSTLVWRADNGVFEVNP